MDTRSDSVPVVRVAAAIVRRGPRFLLTLRPPGTHWAGYWEFPGGKIEAGETVAAALRREVREELGADLEVGPLLRRLEHVYADRHVELHFLHATLTGEAEPRPIEVASLGWYTPDEMRGMKLLPADLPLIDDLARLVALPASAPTTTERP